MAFRKSSKKKLLVLVSAFAKHKDDPGDFICDLSTRLTKEFDVEVLAPHADGLKLVEKFKNLTVYRFPYFYPRSLQQLAYGGGIPYNLKKSWWAKLQVPFFFLAELAYVFRVVRATKPDYIQSHWLITQGLVGAYCQNKFRIPHIATMHSSEMTLLKKIPFGKKIAEYILENSSVIVSVSHHRVYELMNFVSHEVKQKVSKRIRIIPMGIDLKIFNKIEGRPFAGDSVNILFVGRLVEVKGCEYLIKAFEQVYKRYPKAKLTIIGNGPLEERLRTLVETLNLKQAVSFKGFVDHSQIGKEYAASSLVVVPSIVDSAGYEEGLPVVLLEALASGRMVVGTKTKGVMEVVKDGFNGFLAEQKNSRDLAKQIMKCFEPKVRTSVARNARKSVVQYDWANTQRKYAEVITDAKKNFVIK